MSTNKIRLTHYPGGSGVKTEVNGVELQEVGNIRLECSVDDPPVLHVEQFVSEGLEVELNGTVRPTFILPDGGSELEVDQVDGKTRYRAVPRRTT